MQHFEVSSTLEIDVVTLEKSACTMQGVNYELFPFLGMTAPRRWKESPIADWPTGERLFTSLLLIFKVIPFDLHFFKLEEKIENGFQEHSSSLVMKDWRHFRQISEIEGNARIVDRVEFDSRLPFVDLLVKPVYHLVFRYRHFRLRRRYGHV
jgi:hypothetical protein